MDQPTSLPRGANVPAQSQSQAQPAPPQQSSQTQQTQGQQQQPNQTAVALPERPKLAPGVRPAGQMQESGFIDPPWLIEREGDRYVQVTELLHKVAEHCTGENTVEDIAQKISEAGTPVNPATIGNLLTQLLIPRGLVETASGEVMASAEGTASPLAVNMKMAKIEPKYINPITAVLQALYWPPVLIAALIACAAVQAWVLLIHGVGSSLHDMLYAPALMLAALGFILVAAAFHELGHAAALRYGGGQVRSMGAGFYLIYPAFYTDVSDNYRLGRWARVRTDLGGFYFNLLAALAVMGLYVVTGWEFLLVLIVLLDLEILHQSLPFVRLDGYWALADVTGIPDFFSNIGPFLRSILPLKRWEGQKLPELKLWAKAVFVIYILLTIPILLFLLFIIIKGVPRLLATTLDSGRNLAGALSTAAQNGDILGVVASVVQMLTLAIPVVGTAFLLYVLGKRLLGALWRWSQPTPARRAVGVLGTVAMFAFLAFLWAPQLPAFFPGGGESGGPLYQQANANFRPIQRDERITLREAAAVVPVVGSQPSPSEASEEATATPSPTPTQTPTGTPTPAASVTATRTATAAAGVASPVATATPTRTATATPTATATVPGSATTTTATRTATTTATAAPQPQ